MGCSCILLTWACRNRQGSITSRVAKFGKRIKETAIPCLADSMTSIVPFQVHGHSAGRRKAKAAPADRPPGAGEGAFSLSGALSFQRTGQQTGQRAGQRPASRPGAPPFLGSGHAVRLPGKALCLVPFFPAWPSCAGQLRSVPGCARSIPIPPSFATATAPPHLPDAHVTHTAGTPTAKAYAEQRGATQAGNRKYTAL